MILTFSDMKHCMRAYGVSLSTDHKLPSPITSACLVGSAPLVSLLVLTMSSEVRKSGEARHGHQKPMVAANDYRKSSSGRRDESFSRIFSCSGTPKSVNYINMKIVHT